jgi:hypothetical protein
MLVTIETKENLPEVGDVIMSSKFAYCYYDESNVDGKTITRIMCHHRGYEEQVTAQTTLGHRETETRVDDLSRGTAKFVVEQAEWTGGCLDNTFSSFPDGWHIQARRLDEDGKYNPDGEAIEFFMTRGYRDYVAATDVQIVGKMKQRVVFE